MSMTSPAENTATTAVITEVSFFRPGESPDDIDARPIVVQWRGGDTYAILRDHFRPAQVWCQRSGEWEWELQPSERDDRFIRRTRYSYAVATELAVTLAGQA